jgi:acyl-coenzyme A thioesterase 13
VFPNATLSPVILRCSVKLPIRERQLYFAAMTDRPQGLPEEAQEISSAGFNNYVGPFYRLPDVDGGAVRRFAFVVAEKHMNAGGTIHGGMLMSFVDMAMGQTARAETGATGGSTVSLNSDFVGPGRLHDVIEARVRVTRRARTMIFLSAELSAGDRLLLVATGLWKVIGAP